MLYKNICPPVKMYLDIIIRRKKLCKKCFDDASKIFMKNF